MWDAEGTSSQSSPELTTALYLLQAKGRRESEGSKSCRSPSGRSPTRAEKRMSFESASSLPEVSGQQWKGMVQRCREQIFRSAGRAFRYELSRWACGDRNSPLPRTLVPSGGLSGLWAHRSRRPFLWIRRRSPPFA